MSFVPSLSLFIIILKCLIGKNLKIYYYVILIFILHCSNYRFKHYLIFKRNFSFLSLERNVL